MENIHFNIKENEMPPQIHKDMIFTRYLYELNDAKWALLISMFKKQFDNTLFWVYEIVESGFDGMLISWIQDIYYTFYVQKSPHYEKKLSKYVEMYISEQDVSTKLCTIGIVCINMMYLPPVFIESTKNRKNNLHIRLKYDLISKYLYREQQSILPYKQIHNISYHVPKSFIKCITDKCEMQIYDICINDLDLWEYYAFNSPLWKARINASSGSFDINNKLVFPDDELLESFYDKYGYEPDEQSNAFYILHGIIPNKIPFDQFDCIMWEDFVSEIQKYW
jgi:hypothetical protein